MTRRDTQELPEFWALRHVDLDVRPGESFGIVGHNGSGKSTLLKIIARVFGPSEGTCEAGGRISSLLELGAGFHPEFSARENVYLAGAVYGIPRTEIDRSIDAILAFAELEAFADQPIKTFSSGMFMRLGFAVAMHVRPDILLLDEAMAVGDARFVQKCYRRIEEFRRSGGTLLLVTHDASVVRRMCDRALHLKAGRVAGIGDARVVVDEYISEALSDSGPAMDQETDDPTCAIHLRVSTRGSDGLETTMFDDGQPIDVAVIVNANVPVSNAVLRLAVTDETGFELGVRFLRDIDLDASQTYEFTLHEVRDTLRHGHFQLQAAMLDGSSGEVISGRPELHEVTILSRNADYFGPVRIDGAWQTISRGPR